MSGARRAALLAAVLGGGSSPQNVLAPRGPAAAGIEGLWWVLLTIASVVCVVVTVLLLFALRQARRRERGDAVAGVDGTRLVGVGGVALPAVILFGVLIYNFQVGVRVYPPFGAERNAVDRLVVEVVGHQFWWEVRYPDLGITTANEIRIPVDRPVRFVLSAPDVIHSFWVPQLHGKLDMIPGRLHTLDVVASDAGRFRGQCAEFCGESHALMAFWVEALEPSRFDEWAAATVAAQGAGASAAVAAGRRVFEAAGCGGCHATRDAPLPTTFGSAAPDLRDLAARATIAAGTLPNDRASLARWIRAPQSVKPGALMPATPLRDEEMAPLLDYLESLR